MNLARSAASRLFGQRQHDRVAQAGVFPLRFDQPPGFLGRQLAGQSDQLGRGSSPRPTVASHSFRVASRRVSRSSRSTNRAWSARPKSLLATNAVGSDRIAAAQLVEHLADAQRPVATGKIAFRGQLLLQAQQAAAVAAVTSSDRVPAEQRRHDQIVNVVFDRTLGGPLPGDCLDAVAGRRPPACPIAGLVRGSRFGVGAGKQRGHVAGERRAERGVAH